MEPRLHVAKRKRLPGESGAVIPDVYGVKKQKVIEEYENQAGEDYMIVPCDTMVAMQVLLRDFPPTITGFPPIVLKSQLYFSIQDKTVVDRELSQLQRAGQLMQFNIPGNNPNDVFVVLVSDLKNVIQKTYQNEKTEEKKHALELFGEHVVGKHFDTFLTREILESIQFKHGNIAGTETSLESIQKSPIKAAISSKKASNLAMQLIQLGYLTRRDSSSFWLSIPNFGRYAKSLTKGRTFIVKALKSAKCQEMMTDELLKKKIPSSEFPTNFHIKDAIGIGLAQRVSIPSGWLIRLNS